MNLIPGALASGKRDLNRLLVSFPSGLGVLFGPQKADEFREIEPAQVEAIVKGLAGMADYTIIDLPCHPSSANQAAIRHCDFVVLVVEPEPTCMVAGKVALELLESWGVGGGLVGALVVSRGMLAVELREVGSRLGCETVGVVPYAAEAVIAAQERGAPLVIFRPDSAAAINLTEIAGRLAADKFTTQRM